ncbi:hypothetical protein CRYUN_Cryun01aG0095900 [Craigia yunnanensis]
MEKPLLGGKEQEEKWKKTLSAFGKELKKVSYMAVPMVAVVVSQYLLQVISVMMVGHLGELALSGIALGSSFANVTGFSFVVMFSHSILSLCVFHLQICTDNHIYWFGYIVETGEHIHSLST